jgi:Zn-dependent protease
MRATWQLYKWRGIPITLHWTVFLGLPWFYYLTRSVADTVISFSALFFLLAAHELGHAIVAMWRRVRVYTIELFLIHGICTHDEPYYEKDDVLISWGGVAAQFVVLVIAIVAELLLASLSPATHQWLSPLLRVLIGTNTVIMIINLIPVAPLDGATAWRILPMFGRWLKGTSWAKGKRKTGDARKRARDRKLEAESEKIVVDIIDRLKKSKRGSKSS